MKKNNKKILIAIMATILCVTMLLPMFLHNSNTTESGESEKKPPTLEEIAKQEDKYDTKELVENVQKLNEEQMTELTRKTLLVCATNFDTSNTGAVNIEQNDIVYSLTYNTTKEACEAYEKYNNAEGILYCEFDSVLKTQNVEDDFDSILKDEEELNNEIKQDKEQDDKSLGVLFTNITDAVIYSHMKDTDNEIYENILDNIIVNDAYKEKATIVVIDSGATGYTNGYNAFDGSNDVTDIVGHGTSMIEIIKNNLGNSNYEIIPIKVANDNGMGSVSALINALDYVSKMENVTVINMSLCSNDLSVATILDEYITKLSINGTAVIASAGNNNDDAQYYVPAKFDFAVVVGSCDENGNRKNFSNFGNSIDYNVVSNSTSEAAALTSAMYAKAYMSATNPEDIMNKSGIVFSPKTNEIIKYENSDKDYNMDNNLWWCGLYHDSGCGGSWQPDGETIHLWYSVYSGLGYDKTKGHDHLSVKSFSIKDNAHDKQCGYSIGSSNYTHVAVKGDCGWASASEIDDIIDEIEEEEKHVCTYSWTNNSTQHYKKSCCGDKTNAGNHTYGSWTYDTASKHKKVCSFTSGSWACKYTKTENHDYKTITEGGTRYDKCSGCGHIKNKEHKLTVNYVGNCAYDSGHSNGAWISDGTTYSTTAKTTVSGYGLDDKTCSSSCFTTDTQKKTGTMDGPKTVTFTADVITYKITYYLNNGVNNTSNPETYNVTTSTINFASPSKVGAEFKGWTSITSIPKGSVKCKSTTANWRSYIFKVTLNANGGKFPDGSTSKSKEMPYYTNPNDANPAYYSFNTTAWIPTRSGYTFKGWNKTSAWLNDSNGNPNTSGTTNYYSNTSKTADEWSIALTGESIKYKDNVTNVTIYAQWEKVITYNFNYYNNGGTTQKVVVKFHNNDTKATITKFNNNGNYGTPGTGNVRNVNSGSITLKNITSNKTIKFGGNVGAYDWNFNGLAKNNISAIAARYEGTDVNTEYITVYASDSVDSVGSVNFYASYYRQPEITFYDYGNNAQVKRTINASSNTNDKIVITNNLTPGINSKRTVQNITTVYAKYDGTVQQNVIVTLPKQSSMYLTESDGRNVGVNEAWDSVCWSTGSTQIMYGTPTNLKKGVTIPRTKTYTLSGNNGEYSDQVGNTKISTYQDLTYYGLYTKEVNLTVDPNGGVMPNNKFKTQRHVNAYNIYASTKPIVSITRPTYTNETGVKFIFKIWTYDKLEINSAQIEAHRLRNGFYCTDNCTRLHDGQIVHTVKCNSFNNAIHELANDGTATYSYTPLVDETIYASWVNDEIIIPTYEPTVTINKKAEWYNASSSDTGTYDFDALGNINLDGIVKVTITVNITNANGATTKDIYVTDYFNTNIWDLYNIGGMSSKNDDKLTWNLKNNLSGTQTCVYYLKLKEKYWTKDASGDCKYIANELGTVASDSKGSAYSNMVNGKLYYNYYTNRIPNINKYLNSLNADGTVKATDEYFYSNINARKSYVWIDYKVNGGFYNNAERQIHDASADVKMRQVNFIPTVSNGVNIETDEANTKDKLNGMHTNIYHDYSSAYNNTYFVKYNTKGDYNSTFKISMASQLTKSYSYYQITNNLFDVKADTTKKEQVIDNQILVSAINDNRYTEFKENIANTTDKSNKVNADALNNKHLRSGFSAGLLLDVNAQLTIHSSVNTNGVVYGNAAASTKTTLHATNQNDLHISIYPFVKTTNTKTGISYSTSDRIDRNKRLDLVIDATDPVITADKDLISADGLNTSTWTQYKEYCEKNNIKSDGYIDINLINTSTNKKNSVEEYEYLPGTTNPYSYEFKFYDAVSGISNPNVDTSDWIKRPHDNVIVTLTRVDDGKVLFNSASDPYYNKNNKYVSLAYESSSPSSINKNATLKVQFYANDPNNLGHIQLKIRVYDNVYNYTDKVYDFYTFALTANVSIVNPILENDPLRLNNVSHFYNGEQGKINISANGFVDRVTVTHEANFNTAFLKDYTLLKVKLGNDAPKTANSDYPNDDYTSSAYVPADDRFKASRLYAKADGKSILPVGAQQVYWGYQDGKYGGLVMSNAVTSLLPYITINTTELPIQALLPEMISRYVDFKNGEVLPFIEGEYGDYTYAFSGNILYINPVVIDNTIRSAEYYISISSSSTLFGFENLPVALTIDGCTSIPVTYEPEFLEDMTVEEMMDAILDSATVPETVQYKFSMESEWVSDGSASYRKPLVHYFYVPLQLKTHTNDAPNYTTLTAYQDSETGWVHKVTIRVSFTNEDKPILENLDTIISDN